MNYRKFIKMKATICHLLNSNNWIASQQAQDFLYSSWRSEMITWTPELPFQLSLSLPPTHSPAPTPCILVPLFFCLLVSVPRAHLTQGMYTCYSLRHKYSLPQLIPLISLWCLLNRYCFWMSFPSNFFENYIS